MIKKILVLFTVLLLVFCIFSCKKSGNSSSGAHRVAMITDYGDITDQSFNQTTYEACRDFGKKYNVDFKYYKPAGDSDSERVSSIEKAIDDGYNIIVTPGYAFAKSVKETSVKYPDIKFITLDVGKGDWGDFKFPKNLYAAVYAEQYCGYMAGYAAVKMGYRKLGFLGGMAQPAVIRFGYGYAQGIDQAAKELGVNVDLKYIYGNQFYGDADITGVMDTWFKNGTEIVFPCGGGIYTSAAESAKKYGGKIIGVDVDQKPIIDPLYGEGITITSAVKGLYPATFDTLKAIVEDDNWDKYSSKLETLGLVSAEDLSKNYVGIPESTTQFNNKFTVEDLKVLVGKLLDGTYKVTDDTVTPKTSTYRFVNLGNIK